MNRHYYISDDLDELENLEHELEAKGISTEQIHVLSEQDAEVKQHHVNDVSSLMKQDLVHTGQIGIFIGLGLAALAIGIAYFNGWTQTAADWGPFILLSFVLLGFCIWEGGFLGMQKPNSYFQPFEQKLHEGKHIFFVDVKPAQEEVLEQVVKHHPRLELAGMGSATPDWVLAGQQKWHQVRRMI